MFIISQNKHQHNFYQVFQSTLSMDIFHGQVTDMMHSYELFTGRTRKRLTDLEAENLKDIEGMDQSAVDEKLKTIRRDELAEGLISRDFEETQKETLSLQSGVGSVIAKRQKNSLI